MSKRTKSKNFLLCYEIQQVHRNKIQNILISLDDCVVDYWFTITAEARWLLFVVEDATDVKQERTKEQKNGENNKTIGIFFYDVLHTKKEPAQFGNGTYVE